MFEVEIYREYRYMDSIGVHYLSTGLKYNFEGSVPEYHFWGVAYYMTLLKYI